jgi:hypothetical protein
VSRITLQCYSDRPTRLSKKPLFEKPPTTGSKIAKMWCGRPKTRCFSVFLSHFSKIIFEKGLIRQFQRFAFAKHGAGVGVDSAWEQKKLEARKMRAADWASELPANIAQPKRMSAGQAFD